MFANQMIICKSFLYTDQQIEFDLGKISLVFKVVMALFMLVWGMENETEIFIRCIIIIDAIQKFKW
jgi:hypothetical protein